MIVLDTHIWIWWVHGGSGLSSRQEAEIVKEEKNGLGVSAISCWEVAKLVEYGRLRFQVSIENWFSLALGYPGIQLLPLTPRIAVESTRLPGDFHRDPADQIIVATARVYDCPLVTSDSRIIRYPYVDTIS